jgi:hypothetical protein
MITGLQRIGHNLRGSSAGDRGDFVRIYSAGEWIGEHLPWPDGQLRSAHKSYRNQPGKTPPPGTWFHFGLEPPPADLEQQRKMYPGFFYLPTKDDLREVRVALSETPASPAAHSHDFFDNYVGVRGRNVDRGVAAQEWIKEVKTETIVIRPSRSVRKRDLTDQLHQLAALHGGRAKTIILADVPPSVAIDFSHILNEERPSSSWRSSAVEIHILSQDWSCASFKLTADRESFLHSRDQARSFLSSPRSQVSAAFVATILRKHDSDQFWSGVGSAYVNESVLWDNSTGASIRGYLDFSSALAPDDLSDAARRCFRRAVTVRRQQLRDI